MISVRTFSQIALATVGLALLVSSGRADTLDLTNVSAKTAAAQMSKLYGISIIFKSPATGRRVTLSAENPDKPAGRIQAVNGLANSLGMDFQKVFVVSKIDPGTAVPEVALDTEAPVVFPALKTSARDAIKLVAGVDDAQAQISDSITGDVTFPTRQMTVAAAAALIAKQTGTVWKAYYGLFLPGQAPAHLQGTVVGSNGDQPIVALPLITFRNRPVVPDVSATAAGGPNTVAPLGPNVTTVPNTNEYSVNSFSPYGYSPFGYGYDPYGGGYAQNSGFGYAAPNGGTAYPGYVYTPGMGAVPAVPGYNAPSLNSPGYFGPDSFGPGNGAYYGGY